MKTMLNYLIIDELIKDALKEDMPFGDVTTNSIIDENSTCKVYIHAKEDGIICGLPVFERVYKIVGNVDVIFYIKEGSNVFNGDKIGEVSGNTRNVLMGERIALNLLQRMSGIATLTNKYVEAIKGTTSKIVDTRKVTPLYRNLDKYSVTIGGAINHRYSLSDSILIKDNHIDAAKGITNAVNLARKNASFTTKVEVETESLEDVMEAINAKADIIMLDNMSPKMVSEMVKVINGRAIVETSGNITIDNVLEYAKTGVDYISIGALTHSFKVLDISLKNLTLL